MVVEQDEGAHLRGLGDRYGVFPCAVPPSHARGALAAEVLVAREHGIVHEHLGVAGEADDGLVGLVARGFRIRRVAQGGPAPLDPVAQRTTRVMQGARQKAKPARKVKVLACLHRVDVDIGLEILERHGKDGRAQMGAEGRGESAGHVRRAPDVHGAPRPMNRLEEGQPLDVIPVQVGEHDVEPARMLRPPGPPKGNEPGSGVENEAFFGSADFDARGVPAVVRRVGARHGRTATHAPGHRLEGYRQSVGRCVHGPSIPVWTEVTTSRLRRRSEPVTVLPNGRHPARAPRRRTRCTRTRPAWRFVAIDRGESRRNDARMTVVRTWPARGRLAERSAVTMGNFDGVHRGHQAIVAELKRRASRCGGPAVVITFDPHPARVLAPQRAPAMISTLSQRTAWLEQGGADLVWVVPFDERVAAVEPEAFIEAVFVEALRACVVVTGPDARFGRNRRGNRALLEAWGRRHGFVVDSVEPVVHGGARISSSRIREAIARGAVDEAAQMLGRPFIVPGEVTPGDARGRHLGFPTANLLVPVELIRPAPGVYAAWFRWSGHQRMAAVNVGSRPTFDGTGVRIEAHLLDFEGDLYGVHAELAFVRRLRAERRFEAVGDLVAQMRRDVAEVRSVLAASRLADVASGSPGSP